MESGLNPLENLVNYLMGDGIMFSLVQGFLVLSVLFSFIAGRRNGSGPGQEESEVSPETHRIGSYIMSASFYLGCMVFFLSVCFVAEEIAGHRIFWMALDLVLLTYLFNFNKWFAKKLP